MAFGINQGTQVNSQSFTEDNTVEVGEMTNKAGDIVGMATYGGKKETTEEYFLPAETAELTNEALNGQSGITGIVTKHSLTEKNNEWQSVSITKVSALAAPVA